MSRRRMDCRQLAIEFLQPRPVGFQARRQRTERRDLAQGRDAPLEEAIAVPRQQEIRDAAKDQCRECEQRKDRRRVGQQDRGQESRQ